MLRYLLAFAHERSEIPRPVTLDKDIYSLKKELNARAKSLWLGTKKLKLRTPGFRGAQHFQINYS